MNASSSQNRIMLIIGIVAIIIGLGVGLIWVGAGNPAPTANTSSQTTAPAAGGNQAPPSGNSGTTDNSSNSSNSNSSNSSDSNIAPSDNPSANTGEAAPNAGKSPTDTPNGDSSTGSSNSSQPSNPAPSSNPTPSGSNPTSSNPPTSSNNPPTSPATNPTPTAGKGKAKPNATKVAGKGNAGAGGATNNGMIPVSGVVDHVDTANNAVVLDTNLGTVTATLKSGATIVRNPIPGDDANVKLGQISLSDVLVGSYATVAVSRDQIPQLGQQMNGGKGAAKSGTPTSGGPTPTPNPNDTLKNRETLLKRKFGVGEGFAATTDKVMIGPAPASIEQGDRIRTGLRAVPVTFVALNNDGSLTVTVTKYGNVTAFVGPGTQFDRLGQPITVNDLKPGDRLYVYGANVWTGEGKKLAQGQTANPNKGVAKGAAKGGNKGAAQSQTPVAGQGQGQGQGGMMGTLPIAIHLASAHLATTNEHVLQGKVTAVDTSAGTFQINDGTDTITVTAATDTKYASLKAGATIGSLADLKPGDLVTAYTIGDSDVDVKVYTAKTVYVVANQ